MPMMQDMFSRPIVSTSDQVMREAKQPMLAAPYGADAQGAAPTMAPPAALPLPVQQSYSTEADPAQATGAVPLTPQAGTAKPFRADDYAANVSQSDAERQFRDKLRNMAVISMQSGSPALRAQGLQMLLQAEQPHQMTPEEAAATAQRRQLAAIENMQGVSDEAKHKAALALVIGKDNPAVLQALGVSERKPTKGQEAVDREFGKEYAKYVTGGQANIEKNISQLAYVKQLIDDPNTTVSGTVVGNLPDWALAMNDSGRKAISTRELAQEVVQSSLREVLGAQFTQKEGEALMARVFNPRLGEDENKRRLARLTQRVIQAADDKAAAAKYFAENDTLHGFKGRPVATMRDMNEAVEPPQETPRAPHPPRPAGADENLIRAQAKAAIAAGKDPNEIAARLKAWGIAP